MCVAMCFCYSLTHKQVGERRESSLLEKIQ